MSLSRMRFFVLFLSARLGGRECIRLELHLARKKLHLARKKYVTTTPHMCGIALQHIATQCNALHRTALCAQEIWHKRRHTNVALHCNTLQHTALCAQEIRHRDATRMWHCIATHPNTMQHTALCAQKILHHDATRMWHRIATQATYCNTLQHIAAHCNARQHIATHCNALQRTATHCNTLQRKKCVTTMPHTCGFELQQTAT